MIGHITTLLNKIKFAIDSEVTIVRDRIGENANFVNKVSIANVKQTIRQIREQSSIIRNLENNGDVIIIGGLYSVENGEVIFLMHNPDNILIFSSPRFIVKHIVWSLKKPTHD